MLNLNKFLPLWILVFIFQSAFGKLSDLNQAQMPVEWQVIKLQENIEEKITRSLMPIIQSQDYVIEVKIGVDTEKMEDPSSKRLMKNIQRKKVRFSNSELPKDGDDFVLFEKLGLEAPIVGEEPVEMQTSDVELAQRALIEINDRYNLFNYLNTIDINLTFDKGLNDKTKESIQKIVHGLSFNTKDVLPQINIQYIDLKAAREASYPIKTTDSSKSLAENKKKEEEKFFDRFKNLDVMVGLIIAALLLAMAAIYVARKGSKVEEEGKLENENQEEVQAENQDTNEDTVQNENMEEILAEGEDMGIDLTKTDPQTTRIREGLERFRKILTQHYHDMALMLKEWIKAPQADEKMALKGLVQMLSDEELSETFKCLTIDERTTWKMCLDGELSKDELAKAYTFISNQVMQTMMVPSLIDDFEICDLLLAMRPEDVARYSEENPDLGMIFANVLSSKTIGEMLRLVPVDLATHIIVSSSQFRKEDILKMMPKLKEKLLEFKKRRERPPFIKRIFDILPTAKPELEKKLYGTLLDHLSMSEVLNFASHIFPSDLVVDLPDSIFKEAIGKMPAELQVHYFVSLSDDQRDLSLNRFAPKGSKARDMVELEMNSILKNENLTFRIQNEKKESLELEFLKYVREYLNTNPDAKKEVATMVEAWLKEVANTDSSSQHLRMAA